MFFPPTYTANFLSICLLFSLQATTVLADVPPFQSNSKYNNGGWGKYITQTFPSNPEITSVPILNFMKPFSNCDDSSYLFISPRGNIPASTPMILDSSGSLIWASTIPYGEVYNVQVQHYSGQNYLTFWAGNDAVGGHGEGEYIMLDTHYNEQYRIRAANGLGADLHAFTITSDNTAVISIYSKIYADVSSVPGSKTIHGKAWVWDSLFQEVDLETGKAVFEWRVSTHVPVANSYTELDEPDETWPWDAYHINSVEKDHLGNYLISVRFLRAILYIDGKTGNVLWQLGGKANNFTDLSGDGKATTFLGQHDAHWYIPDGEDGKKYITFFDNRADWYHRIDEKSHGTRIELDLENMTARLDQTFSDPFINILSTSQGSYQSLPNGHVLLGYGYNGVVAEFDSNGEMLCEAYFQPSSTFDSGDVQSYRNLKFNWTAFPHTKPDLVLNGTVLYMSWNGATEIDTWLMLGSDVFDEEYEKKEEEAIGTTTAHEDPRSKRQVEDVIIVSKTGFETAYEVHQDDGLRRFIRVVALDKDGLALGTSNVVDIGDLATVQGNMHYVPEDEDSAAHDGDNSYLDEVIEDSRLLIVLGVLAFVSALLITFFALGRRQLLQGWHVVVSEDTEKRAFELKERTTTRLGAFLLRIRNLIPGVKPRDGFSEESAMERLLDNRDGSMTPNGSHTARPLEASLSDMSQGIAPRSGD